MLCDHDAFIRTGFCLLTKINLVQYYFFPLGISTNFTDHSAINICSRSHTKITLSAVPSENLVAYHHQRMKFYLVPFVKSSLLTFAQTLRSLHARVLSSAQ